jgi:flagellar biosynthesis chaperone FliJ
VPRTSKLQNVSEEVAQDFNLVIDRIPEMRKKMNTKLESGMKAAQIAARAKLALTAGDDDEDDI